MALNLQAQHSDKIDSLNKLLKNNMEMLDRAYIHDELSYQWFTQRLDSSLTHGRTAYKLFTNLNNPKGFSQAATSVAIAFHYLNKWDSAAWYYEKALKIREANKDSLKIASSLNNLGVMFIDRKDYAKATNYFIQTMKIREVLRDTMGLASTKFNLGLIFKKQGNFEKAISYYLEAKTVFKKFNKQQNYEIVLLNLGSIYNSMGQFDKGLAYGSELRKMAEQKSSKRNLAKSYVNLSNSYQGLGQADSSLYYITQALTFFEEEKDTLNIVQSLLSISQFSFDRGNYLNSIRYSTQLKSLNKAINNREILVENHLVLARAYAHINEYKKAYLSLQSSYNQKDSLLTTSLNKAITDLTLKYEADQKEKEISLLQIENQEAEIAKQRFANERNVFILVALIVILGAIFLYVLLRLKSKSNLIISKSLGEKEILLREIHHRVKNNLQVISSLLSLQSRFIEDEHAKAAVNEGQNRVKSMALIHQKLYQHDNLAGVIAIDYVKNLTSALKSSYGLDSGLKIKYAIGDLNIDIDTIIPIGLILNELISNAFKHAFPSREKGELVIGLKEEGNKLKMSVKDNGVGATKEISKTASFGMQLIKSLALKLEAEVSFSFNKGTEAIILISNYKLV